MSRFWVLLARPESQCCEADVAGSQGSAKGDGSRYCHDSTHREGTTHQDDSRLQHDITRVDGVAYHDSVRPMASALIQLTLRRVHQF